MCALMVTEAIAEAQDNSQSLYISFLDSAKAFGMVDHYIFLCALHDPNFSPFLWRLYHDM